MEGYFPQHTYRVDGRGSAPNDLTDFDDCIWEASPLRSGWWRVDVGGVGGLEEE